MEVMFSFICHFSVLAIITKAFQGSMRIFSKKLPHPDLVGLLIVTHENANPIPNSEMIFILNYFPNVPEFSFPSE